MNTRSVVKWTLAALVLSGVVLAQDIPQALSQTIVQRSATCYATGQRLVSCAFPSTPAVGNTIILMQSYWDSQSGNPTCASGTVTDSSGLSYSLAVETPLSTFLRAQVWYRHVATPPSGSWAVTVSCPAAFYASLRAIEVSGLVSAGAVDQLGPVFGTGSSVTAALPSPTIQSNELLIALMTTDVPGTIAIASEPGWAIEYDEESCAIHQCGSALTKTVTAAGTYSHTWTLGQSAPYSGALVSFRASVPGGGGSIVVLSWQDNSNNEELFRVQKRTDLTTPNWVDVGTVGSNVTTYVASLQPIETGDCWRVRAENEPCPDCIIPHDGKSGWSNIACRSDVVQPPPPPPPPSGLQISGGIDWFDEDLL